MSVTVTPIQLQIFSRTSFTAKLKSVHIYSMLNGGMCRSSCVSAASLDSVAIECDISIQLYKFSYNLNY